MKRARTVPLFVSPSGRGRRRASAMRNLLAGLLSLSLCVPVFGQLLHMPLLPAAGGEDRQGVVRIVNPGGRAGEVRVGVYDDAGRRRGTVALSFEEGEQVKRFTSEDLENGNAAEGIAGVGTGTGDWRLKMVWRPRSARLDAILASGCLSLPVPRDGAGRRSKLAPRCGNHARDGHAPGWSRGSYERRVRTAVARLQRPTSGG